jgi:hypothetical protein
VISPPRVELYTAPFCALCERARQLLARAGIAFEEIDLGATLSAAAPCRRSPVAEALRKSC